MEVAYINEHLIFGELGRISIYVAFIFSLIAAISYFKSIKNPSWTKAANFSFVLHGIGIFSAIGILFHIMIQRYYEYAYVYDHTNDELPFKYIFSAFWEGQEGSFFLWLFWHVILGAVVMIYSKKWRAPVLSVLCLIQFFILFMLLGIYIPGFEDIKIGNNPFVLLRDNFDAPIFSKADYVSFLEGRGLNPLLQNYWNVIHPPITFLGFASTSIPFAFAVASLWTKDFRSWLRPALSWSAFSGAILGTGILMGGAWAYEALTFGGYWAWDPVENMSLVPWLLMVAGLHTHLVAKSTGHSLRATYVFYLLSFVMIVYSTFLVRSGILEDTSVHAFVESGLEKQLFLFLMVFPLLGFSLFFSRYKSIPSPKKEEELSSREFWMFIGTLVLTISSILITISTSLPVINNLVQIFQPEFEPMVIKDAVPHYNKHQIWIGIFIAILSGVAQWTRYREKQFRDYMKRFFIHMGIAVVISLISSLLILQFLEAFAWQYQLLLFAGCFAVISNLDYAFYFYKKNPKSISSIVSHVGFGIMLVGILFSGLNKEHISSNMFVQSSIIGEETAKSNVLLMKNAPLAIKGYRATYLGDTMMNRNRIYTIRFESLDSSNPESFILKPDVIYNKEFTKIAAYNPDIRWKLSHDISAHISFLDKAEQDFSLAKKIEDSLEYQQLDYKLGDTLKLKKGTFIASLLEGMPKHEDYDYEDGDKTVGLKIVGFNDIGQKIEKHCFLLLREGLLFQYSAKFPRMQTKFKLPEAFADKFFKSNTDGLIVRTLKLQDQFEWKGHEIKFESIQKGEQVRQYNSQSEDIAIQANITIDGQPVQPIYYIRGNIQNNLADSSNSDILVRLLQIDPNSGAFNFVFQDLNASDSDIKTYPIEYAEDVRRTDYVMLSATRFPGINLFWLGSILMLMGLFLSLFLRYQKKKSIL